MTEALRKNDRYKYFIAFFALLVLCWFFPYTGDDWDWGSEYGMWQLESRFATLNGRYAGNLLVMVLTRSNILKTLAMALCLTGALAAINKTVGTSKRIFSCTLLCFAFIPINTLREAVVWTSGFSNFTVSAALTMTYVCCGGGNIQQEQT